ncbi:hypothetical protein CBS147332_5493 [Penicillium roqueforti]|nr:hypothetical protein CBS147332_5493 [Penicillium roqueforti]KAI3107948.1 hypothetical protein CBS147331_6049 [Penicillium roqueforti]
MRLPAHIRFTGYDVKIPEERWYITVRRFFAPGGGAEQNFRPIASAELTQSIFDSDSLNYALDDVRIGGRIMIFGDPDLYYTFITGHQKGETEAWDAGVGRWNLPQDIVQQPILVEYDTADFRKGPWGRYHITYQVGCLQPQSIQCFV